MDRTLILKGTVAAAAVLLTACAAPVEEHKSIHAATVPSASPPPANELPDAVSRTLFIAIAHNDNLTVQRIIRDGIDINKRFGDDTPLTWALKRKQREVIKTIVDAGAEVTVPDANGWSPLQLSVLFKADISTMSALLEKGAHVDGRSSQRNTPLWLALMARNEEAALLLLRANANPNASANNGSFPLHVAISNHLSTVAMALIDKGANVNAREANDLGATPLFTAIVAKDFPLVQRLVEKGADVNLRVGNETPLSFSRLSRVKKITDLLLRHGAHI